MFDDHDDQGKKKKHGKNYWIEKNIMESAKSPT